MTLDEAVDEILKLKDEFPWTIDNSQKCIRSHGQHPAFAWTCTHCPLSALAYKKTQIVFTIHQVRAMAERLNLKIDDAVKIVQASDNVYNREQESLSVDHEVIRIRDRLLALVN